MATMIAEKTVPVMMASFVLSAPKKPGYPDLK